MNIDNLINYVEKNFRKTLYRIDFEILEDISKQNFSEEQIKNAVEICKQNNTDSVRYLQKVLQNTKQEAKTEWLDTETNKQPLDAEDKKIAREFYYQFCDSKEEAEKRIKELNLED